jgi:murein DD-endopeptidase MepM/ murein hydrolase activator NlpD
MSQVVKFIRMACMPVTLLMIPHSNKKSFNIKIPFICILLLFFFWIAGTSYTFFTAVNSAQYTKMKQNLSFYTNEFNALKTNIVALKMAEEQFRYLFSLGSRDAILKNMDTLDSGNIDMSVLKDQLQKTIATVGEIKNYIRHKRDIYVATPKGFPVDAKLTSSYGRRTNPMKQETEFHAGIDLAAPMGVVAAGCSL